MMRSHMYVSRMNIDATGKFPGIILKIVLLDFLKVIIPF